MAITWKQIDTNGNGYVDGNEAQKAKEKGIDNVWNNMMESDYENGTTLANNFYNLQKKYTSKVGDIVYHGADCEEFRWVAKLDREYTILKKQYEKMCKEYDNKFSSGDKVKYYLSKLNNCSDNKELSDYKAKLSNLKKQIENKEDELKKAIYQCTYTYYSGPKERIASTSDINIVQTVNIEINASSHSE